jgi:seryl-tRNA synthetase
MIDLHRLRTEPDLVIALLKKKDPDFEGKKLYDLERQLRDLKQQVDDLRSQKNELAKKGQTGVSSELREKSKLLGAELKEKEAELQEKNDDFMALYLRCPNLLMESIQEGGKENNRVIKVYGEKPQFGFTPRNHVELGYINTWFDFEAASRMAGSNFALYKGEGVIVAYKLMLMMLTHNMKRGFLPVAPPFLVNEKTLEGAGNWPRFKEEVYRIEGEDLFLTPTSEVNLTSMYRDQIVPVDQLPIRMTSWTNCFRREAGGYGSTERGLIRIHQFDKAEIYSLCEPERAAAEHEYMLATAEELLQLLGLHYRVSLLAAQDCSFSSAKTYDIEVWMPGQNDYKEVSSVSNCTDFQARRSDIRYRDEVGAKPKLIHTLNGSSLALPRLLVALMETYQQADGSVALPEVLNSITLI